MRLTALVDVRLGAKPATEVAVVLGIIALVRKHRANPGHDRKGGQEQALEDERVVDVGRGDGAGHRHAIPVGCDVILAAPLGQIRRIGAGEVAPALGAHGTGVEDQVGVAAQHADQYGVDAGQHAGLGPARQAPAQGGQHANGCGGRVTAPAMTRPPTRVDHRRNEMQNPDVQGRCPCLSPQTWAAAGRAVRHLNQR